MHDFIDCLLSVCLCLQKLNCSSSPFSSLSHLLFSSSSSLIFSLVSSFSPHFFSFRLRSFPLYPYLYHISPLLIFISLLYCHFCYLLSPFFLSYPFSSPSFVSPFSLFSLLSPVIFFPCPLL